jgi:uncharacterized protein
MEVMGYIAALFIGISLGLIGGGGSILTVPVMVYLFGISPIAATSYSLFVVGSTSLVGTVSNFRRGLVDLRTALLFGASSVATVFVIRKLVLPLMPEYIPFGQWQISLSVLTMIAFACLMLAASISMIRNGKQPETLQQDSKSTPLLFLYGLGIGLVTGFLGAGGGFLLIPALVLLLQIPMKKAVGTSLLIIAINSLIGFTGDLGHFPTNWTLLFTVSTIAIAGVLVGGLLGKKIEGNKLKTGFGWFVLLMAAYIILRETVLH